MKPPPIYVDRFALAVWNHRNMLAREEYRHHPQATRGPNRYFDGCDHCQATKPSNGKARP